MWKKSAWLRLLLILLAIGVVLGIMLYSLFAASNPSDSSSSGISAGSSADSSTSADSMQPGEWQSETVYLPGDQVSHEGKQYQALEETQGEVPGQSDVWQEVPAPSPSPDGASSPAPESSETGSPSPSQSPAATASASPSGNSSSRPTASPTAAPTATPARPQASPTESAPAAGSQPSNPVLGYRKSVAYYPSWKPASLSRLRYNCLTHVIYAFAIPTEDGELLPLENAATARQIIRDAHKNGVRVLLAVGGWNYQGVPLESTFVKATETAEKREKLAASLVAMCDDFGFDGIDMDWEYPRTGTASQKQYESLMLSLAKKLHPQGRLLTTAVIGGVDASGHSYYDTSAHTPAVIQAVDWINVMAYDANEGEHSTFSFMTNCYYHWRNTRGVPAGKIVLGVPFYARPGGVSYDALVKADPQAPYHDSIRYQGTQVWYNGMETIRQKAWFARQNAGGVMIWEVTQDSPTHSLLKVIGETLSS